MVKADGLLILIGGLQCSENVHTAFQPVESIDFQVDLISAGSYINCF